MVGTGGVGEAAAIIASRRDPKGEWLELMVLSDFNLERAQEVSRKIADARFPAEQVNARNKDEVKALIETYQADLLFNACDPSFNEILFDAAFECGIRYADMTLSLSVPHPTDPYRKTNIIMGDYQFAKHEAWEERGLLALVGIGIYAARLSVHEKLARFGLAMILGGATGNLIDRLVTGYVVDFVDVYWRDYHFWAFNVADSAITLGVAVMILDMIGTGSHVSKAV
jgi:hypothetical protein